MKKGTKTRADAKICKNLLLRLCVRGFTVVAEFRWGGLFILPTLSIYLFLILDLSPLQHHEVSCHYLVRPSSKNKADRKRVERFTAPLQHSRPTAVYWGKSKTGTPAHYKFDSFDGRCLSAHLGKGTPLIVWNYNSNMPDEILTADSDNRAYQYRAIYQKIDFLDYPTRTVCPYSIFIKTLLQR